jgi:hypothetical protein
MTGLYHRNFIGQGQYIYASAQLSLVWFVAPEPHALWEQDRTIVARQGRLWKRPQTTRVKNHVRQRPPGLPVQGRRC